MATIAPTINPGPRTTITWAAITTADVGDTVDISDFDGGLTIHVVGAGTAQFQRSNDNVNFVSWGAALAANTITDQAETRAKFLKISAVAAATVTVILTGRRIT